MINSFLLPMAVAGVLLTLAVCRISQSDDVTFLHKWRLTRKVLDSKAVFVTAAILFVYIVHFSFFGIGLLYLKNNSGFSKPAILILFVLTGLIVGVAFNSLLLLRAKYLGLERESVEADVVDGRQSRTSNSGASSTILSRDVKELLTVPGLQNIHEAMVTFSWNRWACIPVGAFLLSVLLLIGDSDTAFFTLVIIFPLTAFIVGRLDDENNPMAVFGFGLCLVCVYLGMYVSRPGKVNYYWLLMGLGAMIVAAVISRRGVKPTEALPEEREPTRTEEPQTDSSQASNAEPKIDPSKD